MNDGVLESGVKAVGGVVDAMRSQPLAIALVIMNLGLMLFLFYYMSRITSRTEHTVNSLFTANDKLYNQWGAVIKDQVTLTEKTMHCILPEDAIKLLNSAPIQRPAAPQDLTPRAQRLSSPVFKLDLPPLPSVPPH
jgi:hypothetical protein